MRTLIEEDEVRTLIEAKIAEIGSPRKAAKRWGCSVQMVHLVRRKERRPTAEMLKDVGVEAEQQLTVTYWREDENGRQHGDAAAG